MTTQVAGETRTTKLLVVDDDPSMLSQLRLAFGDEYRVFTADGPKQAWQVVQEEHPDLITLDLALEKNDPESGFSVLERCLAFDPLMKIILITGNDSRDNALRAVGQGAFDFFGKPFDLNELGHLLRRATRLAQLDRQNAALLQVLGDDHRLGHLLGRSPSMQSVFQVIRKVAPSEVAVLILGESGTGKELVARELRRLSKRATKPLVSINCGAIPEALLESELFGHEKGSFTSAHTSRPGKLELADGGIVFLDEIGEMPLALQVKLLRFLQEKEVERVGGRIMMHLDVRVFAASNRNLAAEVKRGRFREDLYYRLSVVNIDLPPLRERREDVLYLASYFLNRFAAEAGRGKLSFGRAAEQAMQRYEWPGNVRELEHHVQRAVLLSSGRLIGAADLALASEGAVESLALRRIRDDTDRSTIVEALRRTCGNISKAATELEISRPSLHDLLRKHQIDASTFRSSGMAPEGDVVSEP